MWQVLKNKLYGCAGVALDLAHYTAIFGENKPRPRGLLGRGSGMLCG